MTIHYVNTGSSPNAGNGDSLRVAFNKINANFQYLSTASFSGGQEYTPENIPDWRGSPTVATFSQGLDELASRMVNVESLDLLNLPSGLIPDTNLAYDLGSTSSQWRSLYVGTSTIYLGGTALSVAPGGLLTVDGNVLSGGSGDRLVNGDLEVVLNTSGTLTTPLLLPRAFTAVLDEAHRTVGSGSYTGPAWAFHLEWQCSQNGQVELIADNGPLPSLVNGYADGQTFVFTSADHGIPDYTLTVVLSNVVQAGPAGWTANLSFSPPPAYPPTIASSGAIKLASNGNSFILGTDGGVTFSDSATINSAPGGYVRLRTYGADNNSYSLTLDNDGVVYLPTNGIQFQDGSVQTTAFQGGDTNVWVEDFISANNNLVQGANSVEYDADGNAIAVFSITDPNNNTFSNTLVAKFDTTGTKQWEVIFQGGTYTDGWGLAVDPVNNKGYVAGRTTVNSSYDQSLLTKFDLANGNIVWTKQIDFEATSNSPVVDVDSNGNPVMVGYANNGTDDYVTVTKLLASDGSVVWCKTLDGYGDERASGMAIGPNDEVVVIGYEDRLSELDPAVRRVLVAKFDVDGVLQWQKSVEIDAGKECSGADADIDSLGNIYVCGNYSDINDNSQVMFMFQMNSQGVGQWTRRVKGNCNNAATSIVVGPDDHLYLSAVTGNNGTQDFSLVLAKYNRDGTVVWQRLLDNTTTWTFGGNFWFGNGGGSNLAVKSGYVIVAGGFADPFGTPPRGILAQVNVDGTQFATGNYDFKSVSFSGLLTGAPTMVTDTRTVGSANPGITDFDPDYEYNQNQLTGTLYVAGGGVNTNSINNGEYSVSVGANGVVTMVTSRGTVEFGALPEPGGPTHFHIMRPAGQEGSSDLYFGDDYNYVKLPANYGAGTLGVEIGTNDTDGGDQNVWRFETDGNLTTPGHIFAQQGNDLHLRVFNPTVEGTPGGVTLSLQNRDVETGNKTTQFNIAPTEIVLTTDFSGNKNEWLFGTDGDLVLPEGKTIRDTAGTDLLSSGNGLLAPYKGFRAHYGTMYNNGDDNNGPINKLVIYKSTVTPASAIDVDTSSDDFQVTGLTGSDIVAMLVVVSDGTDWDVQTPTATLKTFAEAVIDNVILDAGAEGTYNNVAEMKTAFYANFSNFNTIIPNPKVALEFFSTNNQFNINPQYTTGDGASFSSITYNMNNGTLDLGSWGQGAPNTHEVNDVHVIPGNTIQDANGNFLLTPDNDVTVTITGVGFGAILSYTVTGTLPRPSEIWPDYSIDDGGDDEYDGANAIHTNLAAQIIYNNGNVVPGSSAFGGGDYVVTYQAGIFGIFATGVDIDVIGTSGEDGGYGNDNSSSGFDSDGVAVTGSLYGDSAPAVTISEITNTDGTNNYSVSVGTNGVVSMVTSRGTVEFGALPEPGGPSHFHIMKASGDNNDLYFGDDFNYVLQRGPGYGPTPGYGVEIGANDKDGGGQQVWRFGTDGGLTLPSGAGFGLGDSGQLKVNDGITSSLDLRDTSGRGFYTNGDGYALRSNGNNTWQFGTTGTLTFPQGGTLRVGTVPAHSTGAVNDKAGTVAFANGYIYYCTADYAPTQYPAETRLGDANGVDNGYLIPDSYSLPSTGWIIYYNNQTAFIDQVNTVGNPGYYTVFTATPLFIPANTAIQYGPPSSDIWKRVAWSGDTW